MPKYIDVGAINWYDNLFMKGVNNGSVWVRYKDVESLIRNAPAADVTPVRHGRWIDENPTSPLDPRMRCSICGHVEVPMWIWCFCPVCGAKMDAKPPKEKRDD